MLDKKSVKVYHNLTIFGTPGSAAQTFVNGAGIQFEVD